MAATVVGWAPAVLATAALVLFGVATIQRRDSADPAAGAATWWTGSALMILEWALLAAAAVIFAYLALMVLVFGYLWALADNPDTQAPDIVGAVAAFLRQPPVVGALVSVPLATIAWIVTRPSRHRRHVLGSHPAPSAAGPPPPPFVPTAPPPPLDARSRS